MSVVLDVPVSQLNFQQPRFADNPYPAYRELREAGPLSWHEPTGKYLVTNWREATRILLNPREFGSDENDFIELFGGRTMECMERDRHREVRGIWHRDFEPGAIRRSEEIVRDVIRSRLDPFVERMRDGETADAVAGMTRGIPTIVIARMLGIPDEDYELFAQWSDAIGDIGEGATDPSPRGAELLALGIRARTELNDYLRARLNGRCPMSGGDLISKMVESPVAKTMEEAEIIASITQLVFAGNETTAKLMAITMLALAAHPDQRAALVRDRSLIPQALEEIHRWNSVVHLNGRFARGGNASVGGHRLEDGARVLILQGAINRDPERWDDPDALDILRPRKQHLGFGFGMHICLGSHLARLESEIWLDVLLDALPKWEVVDVDWGTNWTTRGPIRLDVHA